MSVCCLLFFRVQRKVVSLCVYREGDWLRLEGARSRFDSINTLVMRCVIGAVPVSIGVLASDVKWLVTTKCFGFVNA